MERINLTGEMDTFSMYVLHTHLSIVLANTTASEFSDVAPGQVCQETWLTRNARMHRARLVKQGAAIAVSAPSHSSQRIENPGEKKGNSELVSLYHLHLGSSLRLLFPFRGAVLVHCPSCCHFPVLTSRVVNTLKASFA